MSERVPVPSTIGSVCGPALTVTYHASGGPDLVVVFDPKRGLK